MGNFIEKFIRRKDAKHSETGIGLSGIINKHNNTNNLPVGSLYDSFIEQKKYLDIENNIKVINQLLINKNLEEAYERMLNLKDKFEKGYILENTENKAYYSFSDNVEFVSKVLDDKRNDKYTDIEWIGGYPIHEMYRLFAYVYISKQDYAQANKMIKKALRWNPISAGVRIEETQIWLENGDISNAILRLKEALKYATKPDIIALAYRKLGYCFIELGKYSIASSLYIHSLYFEDNPVAIRELDYIQDIAGENFQFPDEQMAVQILSDNEIDIQIGDIPMAAYIKLLEAADNEHDLRLFESYKQDLANMLFNPEQKEKILGLVLS